MMKPNPKLKRIYLSPPHIGEYEQQFVAEAFASNWIALLALALRKYIENYRFWLDMKYLLRTLLLS